ncbi:MAG: hypothetical protein LUG85_06240 [Clostridiales bacterium]|nr:hypothetical protein [Clostridiales bacterium]
MERKIRDLISTTNDVYIILKSAEIAERFVNDADAQGITFGDGVSPKERSTGDIYRLYQDGTISYVGFVGHVRVANDHTICRVDYEKYINGVADV